MINKSILIVAASGTAQFAQNVSRDLHVPILEINATKFPNEELRVRVSEAGTTTILIGSLSKPVNTRIIEYILAADALKRGGCHKLIGVLSWYAYSKQDKVFLEGEPLSAQVIANILQDVALDELYTLDLHSPVIKDYFSIPVINMTAVEVFIRHFQRTPLTDAVVVSPDTGSISNSTLIAQQLQLPLVKATKKRDLFSGQVTYTNLDGDVAGKNVLIFDDMIATGSTLVELAEFLHLQHAGHITVSCTHHLYVEGAQDKLDASFIDDIYVTNSIQPLTPVVSPKLSILDVSPVIAQHLSHFKPSVPMIK